ncbi:IPT/TIG domain-containing protein [Robiginitalea sp. SC105]|uniref:NHL domain-containing protein n=1 Tax=Robiginitalea sp. SC105 TaxID=2762332 RepID=UPI001639CDB7|nr:IPT/TIG domain-containing protein [Robiginitalea sp. SC105]MBC2840403.1 IPT/TIG domain-containing protein [Robiginitalea sp. SC105]
MCNALSYRLILCFALLVSCSNDGPELDGGPGNSTISIDTISPESGPRNTVVTISGKNFGSDPNVIKVFFNGSQGEVESVEDDVIVAIVPTGAFTGRVTVSINGQIIDGPEFTYIVTDEYPGNILAGSTRGSQDGQGSFAQFNLPAGVAIDKNGNVYVADAGNHRIRKITSNGLVSTLAGSAFGFADGQGVVAQFNAPNGLALDVDGNVYVADRYNHSIRKITPGGEVSTLAGSTEGYADGQGEDAQFNEPYAVALDVDGTVYVADAGNNRIRKITPNGLVSTLAGSSPGFADGQGEDARFNGPYGIALDALGNAYVADFINNRIRRITPDGVVSTLAGNSRGFTDGQGADARFDGPYGVALDMAENLYIADFGNQNIRKITPEGTVSTLILSSTGSADGQWEGTMFSGPSDVALDKYGTVYVADMAGHLIHKFPLD